MTVGRTDAHFESAGATLRGWLYSAPDAGTPSPAVVLCTGFAGTQDTPLIVAAAEAFARAGLAALTFDYRSFGRSDGEPRQLVSIEGQRADITAALRFLKGRDDIDADRIALWGTSLGGSHVVTVAADEPCVAAVVSQIPFNGFPRRVEGRPASANRRLLWAMIRDALRARLGRPPLYIPAVGGAGELAVMASSEASQTVRGLQSEMWQNRTAPRALFEMMRYKPGAVAGRVRMPLLVCVGGRDKESPEASASELGEKAPLGRVLRYDVAHFDFYEPEVREKVLGDQVRFLDSVLLTGERTP